MHHKSQMLVIICSYILLLIIFTAFAQEGELVIGSFAIVSTEGENRLNVRADAGTSHQIVDRLSNGTRVKILEGPVINDDFVWWLIETPNGLTGWTVESISGFRTLVPDSAFAADETYNDTVLCGEGLSMLGVGDVVTVSDADPSPLPLRSNPSAGGQILVQIPVRTILVILDGPNCNDGWVWWRTNYDGVVGWVAEVDQRRLYNLAFLREANTNDFQQAETIRQNIVGLWAPCRSEDDTRCTHFALNFCENGVASVFAFPALLEGNYHIVAPNIVVFDALVMIEGSNPYSTTEAILVTLENNDVFFDGVKYERVGEGDCEGPILQATTVSSPTVTPTRLPTILTPLTDPDRFYDGAYTACRPFDIRDAEIIYVNGIRTDARAHYENLEMLCDFYADRNVMGIYNATGKNVDWRSDIQQAINDSIEGETGIRSSFNLFGAVIPYEESNPAIDSLVNYLLQNDHHIAIIAHSQGAAIVSAALQRIETEHYGERNVDSSIDISIYGGFAMSFPDGPLVSTCEYPQDPIPNQFLDTARCFLENGSFCYERFLIGLGVSALTSLEFHDFKNYFDQCFRDN